MIALYEVYESRDHVNLIFDFLRGGDLHKRVAKVGPYSELGALAVFEKILDGLAHLHSRNIIHRDLKLDNIFLE